MSVKPTLAPVAPNKAEPGAGRALEAVMPTPNGKDKRNPYQLAREIADAWLGSTLVYDFPFLVTESVPNDDDPIAKAGRLFNELIGESEDRYDNVQAGFLLGLEIGARIPTVILNGGAERAYGVSGLIGPLGRDGRA